MNAVKEQVSFKIVAISPEIAESVRATLRSSWAGLPASVSIATGYGPCRSCLKIFETGKDERIFFTYNPFEGRAGLPLPGPIFIHKEACESYTGGIFPPDLRGLPMLFEAFFTDGEMLKRVKVAVSDIETRIEELFAIPAVNYIYVRNAEAGCFMAFIEGADQNRLARECAKLDREEEEALADEGLTSGEVGQAY